MDTNIIRMYICTNIYLKNKKNTNKDTHNYLYSYLYPYGQIFYFFTTYTNNYMYGYLLSKLKRIRIRKLSIILPTK